jgi:hypothetical protein
MFTRLADDLAEAVNLISFLHSLRLWPPHKAPAVELVARYRHVFLCEIQLNLGWGEPHALSLSLSLYSNL